MDYLTTSKLHYMMKMKKEAPPNGKNNQNFYFKRLTHSIAYLVLPFQTLPNSKYKGVCR